MLRPRVIPCLLLSANGLVKTVKFNQPKYVGDPLNAVRIFNEKGVDELIVLDIDASVEKREPKLELIGRLAVESRMPLCYGGGVRSVEQIQRIVELGVEKVAINTAALTEPDLVSEAAQKVGSQSVVVVQDVARINGKYEVLGSRGKRRTGRAPAAYAALMQELGAGEIVLNNVDRDGTLLGYDTELVREVKSKLSIPLTVLGGAGSLAHLRELFSEFGIIGAGAGSLFVFKGKYRAVLISYPSLDEKRTLYD